MTRVRLEIDEVQIHRPKKRWKLYFLVVTDQPTEEVYQYPLVFFKGV